MSDLFDAPVRHRIRHSLDETMLVEAAAGTGKTTELVERIVNVLATGRASVREIVAVTFTEKAAGELKLRLRERLERERQDPALDRDRRTPVERALAGLEEAHVDTIHGFCADLLRERPVEARVDPAFEVMTEPAAERLYARVFDAWLQDALADPPSSLRRALHRPLPSREEDEDERGPVERLRRCGWDLIGWRDFTHPWSRDVLFDRAAGIDCVRDALREFAVVSGAPARKSDNLHQDTRFLRDCGADLELAFGLGRADLDELEGRLVALGKDARFRNIRRGGGAEYSSGIARTRVLSAKDGVRAALDEFIRAADADLAAGLQQDLAVTTAGYEEEKARTGRLDFLDLLLGARNLLRDHPEVRFDLQRRFRRLFVDEFQDTDPIQAEILLLLASDDPAVADWRLVRPRPGALFVVADPKQSIYRFRRADVGIYDEVKQLLARAGVDPLPLSTSFRSAPVIQRFVNGAFAPIMTGDAATQQASYVSLGAYRRDSVEQPAIVALPVPRPYGMMRVSGAAIEKSLPDATAAFVDWLLRESEWTVTERTPRSGEDVRVPIAARHVCLLFRRFESWGGDATRPYVDALEARGVPHLLVGGRSFDEREEIATMTAALAAIEWPDDELSVFATLRGSLFAIPDATLLEFRHRGGRFHAFMPPGEIGAGRSEPAPDCQPVLDALGLLRRLHFGRNRVPVSATLAALLDATRAHASFALRPSGEQALANVLHVAELARRYEAAGGLSFRGFVEELRNGRFGDTSEAPVLEEGGDGVRIMTVHRAKGLEFPVVVLTDMTANRTSRQANRLLDPGRNLCALRVLGCAPRELLEDEAAEIAREAAESVRVTYVAATRARDLLVVPAVGDEPYADDKWLSPLSSMLYPAAGERRHPTLPPKCPRFGKDSVVARPGGDPASNATVAPGLHRIAAGESPVEADEASRTCEVVWWDPHVLSLESRPAFGLRHTDLIGKDADPSRVAADLEAFHAWERSRAAAREHGRTPRVTVESVHARVARLEAAGRLAGPPGSWPDAAGVPVIDLAARDRRRGGVRYGTLLHDLLAQVPLDSDEATIVRVADARGRLLGATRDEIASGVAAVCHVLRHDILARAREAETQGRLRRETPVTLRTDDGTIVEGIVDLAFEEHDAWLVVDFKTDRDITAARDRYCLQVALYAEAIARATGLPAKGLVLWI